MVLQLPCRQPGCGNRKDLLHPGSSSALPQQRDHSAEVLSCTFLTRCWWYLSSGPIVSRDSWCSLCSSCSQSWASLPARAEFNWRIPHSEPSAGEGEVTPLQRSKECRPYLFLFLPSLVLNGNLLLLSLWKGKKNGKILQE